MLKLLPSDMSCLLNKTVILVINTLVTLLLVLVLKTHVGVIEKPCTDIAEDYIRVICQTEKFKQNTNRIVYHMKSEDESKSDAVRKKLISVASEMNLERNMVLFTVVNEAYLPLVYSWLCNTKDMNIHKSVLIATTDAMSMEKLKAKWPEINAISLDIGTLRGNQFYGEVGYMKLIVKRAEMTLVLLMANIDVLIFEVDCVWLSNPISSISFNENYDIVVNPVSGSDSKTFSGGFLLLHSTCRTKIVWHKVVDFMMALAQRIESLQENESLKTFEDENDQIVLARLLRDGYGNVTIKMLPLEMFADGKWYSLSVEDRSKSRPVIINNNWIVGNDAKMRRAKEWKHWFVHDDFTCDMDLVHKTIYQH